MWAVQNKQHAYCKYKEAFGDAPIVKKNLSYDKAVVNQWLLLIPPSTPANDSTCLGSFQMNPEGLERRVQWVAERSSFTKKSLLVMKIWK